MAGSLGFGTNDSDATGRQGSEVLFPKQFALDLNKTLGGPFTIQDLFRLAPTPHSLFGYGPKQAQQPSGAFSLGFGPPGAATPGATPTTPGVGAPTTPGTPGLTTTPTPTSTSPGGKVYSLADLTNSYFKDPDKVMDLPRLFRQAGLNGTSFTYDDIAKAVGKAKKYGFSGRSQKNFANMLAGLQRDSELDDAFVGGKGTGIF